MNMLARYFKPDELSIKVHGTDVTRESARLQQLSGYLPNSTFIYIGLLALYF